MHGLIACRGNIVSSGRPGYRSYPMRVAVVVDDRPSRGYFPDVHCRIITSRGNILAAGGPCQGLDCTCMAIVSANALPRRSFPNLDGLIVSAGSNVEAIGRPGCGIDWPRVALVGEDVLPAEGIPDLHAGIEAARGDTFATRQPGHGKNPILPVVGIELIATKSPPDLHRAIAVVSTGGDMCAVGRPGYAAQKTSVPVVGGNGSTCESFPYPYAASSVARCKELAIGRPGKGKQIGCVALVNKVILASAGFPDSYRHVARAGSDPG